MDNETIEVVETESRIANFKSDVAKEVVATLIVVTVLSVSKALGKVIVKRFHKTPKPESTSEAK